MKLISNETEKLKVDFQSVRYGLIYFTLTLNEKPVETNFSDVFDPILDFKSWLEAICVGVQQCSFTYDPEGDYITFDFERLSWDREVFTVKYPNADNDEEPILAGKVDRKQVVGEFYFGLLNFRNSPEFERYAWEKEILSDRLTSLLQIDYETLLNNLCGLGRKQLNDWLCKADPRWQRTGPTEQEDADLTILLKTELSNGEKTFNRNTDRSEIDWNIPLDYSNWKLDKKRILVAKCLSENCSRNDGTRIDEFRSQIIENYLAQ